MTSTDELFRDIANEITIRTDFEASIRDMDEKFAGRSGTTITDCTSPWLEVLSQQPLVASSAVLRLRASGEIVVSLSSNESHAGYWMTLINSLGADCHQTVASRSHGCFLVPPSDDMNPDNPDLVVMSPCIGSEPLMSIAVVGPACHGSLIQWMADYAASRLALRLMLLERGHREMAGIIAQMSGGSVLRAQLRLKSVLNDIKEPSTRESLESALRDLSQAQKGFDRARLLAIPWSNSSEEIEITNFVRTIMLDMNNLATDHICAQQPQFNNQPIMIEAAPVRLHYAIRDLILGAWLLCNRKSIIHVSIKYSSRHAFLTIAGAPLAVTTIQTSEQLADFMSDPTQFLMSPDEFKAESHIGFSLAYRLIEEIAGASIVVELTPEERQVVFNIQLPLKEYVV